MNKKILCFVLAMLMLMSTLAACGGKSESGETKPAANANVEKADIQLSEVKPTLKVLGSSSTSDLNETAEAKVIREATGYTVEFYGLPAENANQALMLTMANKNDYDMVTMNQTQFSTLMTNNALLPLNDYIDAIAPELWDCIPASAWAGVSDAEGNVYAFPKLYSVDTEVASFMAVRMDLLKAAGINELPTTISEFKDVLFELKAFYGDEYIILSGPYNKGGTGNYMNIPFCITSAFGIYDDWMVDENGKVIYMTEHKNFPAMMKFMNELYEAGILDIDYAANSWKAVDEKFASGKAIIAINSREKIDTNFATLAESGVGIDDVEFIGALKGDDGTCVYMQTAQYASFTSIPRKNPQHAADVVNYIAEFVKNQELIVIGEEGVHFNWVDGYPVPIQPAFTDERNLANKYVYLAEMDSFKVLFTARLQKSQIMWKAYTNCTIKTNEETPEIFVPAYFAYTNGENYINNNTALRKNLNDFIALLVVGQRDVEADMGTFTADFNNLEGAAMKEELQAWYDSTFQGQ